MHKITFFVFYLLGAFLLMKNCFAEWLTDKRRLALFPVQAIVRDLHHFESLTRGE